MIPIGSIISGGMKSLENIYRSFDGKLVGSRKLKHFACLVLSKMPDEIITTITQDCWVLGSSEDAWAFTFTGNDLKNQHLIILSDHLFLEKESQIQYTIAHEIGHVVLKHRNSVFEHQSKQEVRLQEEEADQFARKYLGVVGDDIEELF